MSNEKPRRPGFRSTGGDRPMHRRDAKPYQARDRRRDDSVDDKPRADKPRADKPRADKPRADKPRADKPRADKPRVDAPRSQKPRPAESRAPKAFEGERVAKVMARAGLCSRRDAEEWIAQGRVAVNGRLLMSPAVNVRAGDRITVDGKPLAERERTRLFLFHKPAGLVTSAKDPEGRETVFEFLAKRYPDVPRVVSVGRLDINSEGLLLLTNDGGLARTLELPATGWARRYRVRAHGSVDQAALDALKQGVTVDGIAYAPIEASLDRLQGANAWISMSLREGKNREIKRVLEHLGLEVTRLIRVSFGPFQLGEMGEGEVAEVRLKVLREQLGKGLAELAGVDFSSPLKERGEQTPGEAQEARERAQKRTRKHVSVLRTQHDESRDKSPRSRIERGATADHKGRAVAVEKIVAAQPRAEPMTRNARRFRAERQAIEEAAPRRQRSRSRFGAEAPAGRPDAGRDERPRRFERDDRRGGKAAGASNKPFGGKPRGERQRFDANKAAVPRRSGGSGAAGAFGNSGGPRKDGAGASSGPRQPNGPRKPGGGKRNGPRQPRGPR